MMAKYQRGDVVRVNAVVPQGPIQGFRMDEETGEVYCLIEWTDANGEFQQRWFKEDDLTGV
jgi:uncharacterized protein YodC (DUF2158 family)